MPGAAPDQSMFHHHGALADPDLAVFGGQNGSEQDPRISPDVNGSADHRGRRDVGAGVNLRCLATMLNKHAHNTAALRSPQRHLATVTKRYERYDRSVQQRGTRPNGAERARCNG
jgi:hypothetical protein